mmetsp:Transcript_6402/g.18866  ORF Transcript_6402/g.18866 Transcript_6402/m.18866 type:complete len:290 (+) Transcript_6402:283-1152(+)
MKVLQKGSILVIILFVDRSKIQHISQDLHLLEIPVGHAFEQRNACQRPMPVVEKLRADDPEHHGVQVDRIHHVEIVWSLDRRRFHHFVRITVDVYVRAPDFGSVADGIPGVQIGEGARLAVSFEVRIRCLTVIVGLVWGSVHCESRHADRRRMESACFLLVLLRLNQTILPGLELRLHVLQNLNERVLEMRDVGFSWIFDPWNGLFPVVRNDARCAPKPSRSIFGMEQKTLHLIGVFGMDVGLLQLLERVGCVHQRHDEVVSRAFQPNEEDEVQPAVLRHGRGHLFAGL